ncbi:MAG TPA: S46 family peptidase [Ideonella sp.]|uniref:S46 family peptidase n=1 Tax=Ideonella sp. TaxID=1929293 RepID=UPI002E31CF73|nr:S46 family peptidase [Ideonella sp.]HEX5684103.1 S46 family peptidase [Ideonella sp.]
MTDRLHRAGARFFVATMALAAATAAIADDGMWTFDNPPIDQVRERYGVTLSPSLLKHLQHAAVNYDASASFVSASGLMLTNHHVAIGCIEQLSSAKRDLVKHGHIAASAAQELRCPGGTARVLQAIEDVTETVRQAMARGSNDEQRNALRKEAIAGLEKNCDDAKTSRRCEVVSLYSGALFHLYRFKEWDDVRLVFAPEFQAAFFGGDPDNFVYPRFALDFALMRVYENGKPIVSPQYLKLADKPVAEGDAVFVIGHPGRTDRLQTVAQLQTNRDTLLPLRLASAEAQQRLLRAYSKRSAEAARQAVDRLFGTENWLKSMRGEFDALNDAAVMAAKQADEARFRSAYAERGLKDDPWATVQAATSRHAAKAKELWAVGYGYKTLFEHAGNLVELAYERQLPEAQRLEAFRESALPDTERKLKADAPLYKDLEIARLAGQFREAQALLGAEHRFVKTVLGNDSPEAAAERWVRGSRVDDVAVRTALMAGGVKAIEASDDPLIKLAREVYPLRRELARFKEEQVDTPIERAADHLGQARFTIYGRNLPPDATGTLRLSYGKVTGYESRGWVTPWKTTFGGLLARADAFDGKRPFDLPPSIQKARARIDARVPLDFVTTADIIGGNSGSPVVNHRGELVGLMFDSNLEALGGRFIYTDAQARSIAVHAQAIVYALEQVYGAQRIARELHGRAGPGGV